ncbi:MAG: DUF2783 domain-containing protein [Alphaproteobacteria bacterium]|nr:DUF2783 domain-containing protein [Alphaproteobacteria bacterium]
MTLITDYNFGDNFAGDDIYQQLLEAHQGLSNTQSHALNARLVLILMNHIGDKKILAQAINEAKLTKENKNE